MRRGWFLAFLGIVALSLVVLSAYQRPIDRADAQTPGPDVNLDVTVSISKPANGTYFVAGESARVLVTLKDKSGAPISKNDFATLNLYAYGPQETTKTVSAVKLLNATTDRTKTPHHYIDLLKDTNVRGGVSVVRYNLQPVTDEEAGTYTA